MKISDSSKTVCFTGHRPQKISRDFSEDSPYFKNLKLKIETQIVECIFNGFDTFLTGMAMGSDIICAELVLKQKALHPNIKLIACIPYKAQADKFPFEWKTRYNNVLKNCNDTVFTSDYYASFVFKVRNQFMVNNSDVVIAVFNGNIHSGTFQTMNLALKQNKKIITINI